MRYKRTINNIEKYIRNSTAPLDITETKDEYGLPETIYEFSDEKLVLEVTHSNIGQLQIIIKTDNNKMQLFYRREYDSRKNCYNWIFLSSLSSNQKFITATNKELGNMVSKLH